MDNTFQWNDALVAEYSLSSQKMPLFEFKKFVIERQQAQKQPQYKYIVYTKPTYGSDEWFPYKIGKEENPTSSDWKEFENEYEASVFILHNRPKFSAKAILNIIEECGYTVTQQLYEKFTSK